MLEEVHETFKGYIIERRGERLSKDLNLFTGEFWAGQKSIELGLADHIGHLDAVIKELVGDKVRIKNYGPKKGWAARLSGKILDDTALMLEEKLAFAKYGL